MFRQDQYAKMAPGGGLEGLSARGDHRMGALRATLVSGPLVFFIGLVSHSCNISYICLHADDHKTGR